MAKIVGTTVVRARKGAAAKIPRGSEEKLVTLRVAAAALHECYIGNPRASMRGPEYLSALNRAAGAVAQLVTVFCHNEKRQLVAVPKSELLAGNFEDGGNLLRVASSGSLYRALRVRKAEVVEAMEVIGMALHRGQTDSPAFARENGGAALSGGDRENTAPPGAAHPEADPGAAGH